MNFTIEDVIEAHLTAMEAHCTVVRMLLAIKKTEDSETETAAPAPVPEMIIEAAEDGFVMPPTFRNSKD